ncbi:oxidoreductase domain containing protein [Caldicellulosiruptor saccharolyticus DSM 8903]|uniref:Oxidoreductase domain containing protein n=1 Tax=Caldicellulosiruptor saccharolyticus (strain ATCC 43494 / DSM 8903 / Tp8T 6331) TaxID=351627 RepID=A4XN18_CALS8|nr:Gfo/Idh/MocA family oxidoreductase [Caldicellulosiruptor saccharolyticus]ABP68303.1 oxidoreductase domain containing protein [Caldicellulosiruptor saccharolyticus DSM 8903]
MINIGIIGFGWMGQIHAKNSTLIEDCKLKAVADLDPQKLRIAEKLYGADVYQDYRQLLDRKDINAVYVVTPATSHYQIVKDSIEANKHVLCEKPLALTPQEVNSLREIVKKSDRKFIICFPERFAISSQEAKDMIDQGVIGEIQYIRGNFRFTMKGHDVTHGEWVFDRSKGGGLILEASVHLWDFVRWLSNQEVTSVIGVAHEYMRGNSLIEDNFAAIGYLEKGGIVCIDMSGAFPKDSATDKRFEIIGSEGYIYIDEFKNYMTINSERGIDANPGMLVKGMTYKDVMWHSHVEGGAKRLQEYFIRCIKKDEEPKPGVEDGARACEISWAIMDSLKSKKLEVIKYGKCE